MTRLNYLRFAKNFALNNFSFNHIYKPLNAQIELTLKCNGKCVFCSIWHPEFQRELQSEMTTGEVKYIIDDLFKLGVQVVNFTGGEPTLRTDLPELISYVKNKGMMPTVATNGLPLCNWIKTQKFKDVEWIMVSLDWPFAEKHDEYRGVKMFDQVIKGIRAAVLERKTVLISMVVTNENIHYMEEMCRLSQDLGTMIEMLPCENIIREQDSAHMVESITHFIPDIPQYAQEIRRLVKLYPNLITDTVTADIIEAGGFGNQRLLRCVSAKAFLVINYKGEVVFPCKVHPILKVNVKNRSLYDVYYSYEAKKIMDMKDGFPFCKGCRLGCAIATSIPTRWATLYEKYIKAFINGNLF
ncbi:MAG: radical SAM protein [Promethearchaeota archaeon]